jgi:hypothetical protein
MDKDSFLSNSEALTTAQHRRIAIGTPRDSMAILVASTTASRLLIFNSASFQASPAIVTTIRLSILPPR